MTAPLWTSDDVVRATRGTAHGAPWQATGVAIDSRAVVAGDLFIAIPGERFDGHTFVAQALAAGAVAAVVSHRPAELADDARLVVVYDTMAALVDLARAARDRSSATVVSVTGSVGKTGTKEALGVALAGFGQTHVSGGNLNNHIGAPLSLARLPASARYAVLELGMNHKGEISPLSRLVRPHLSIITNVEAVHIEFFDSEAGIAAAKAEIFEGMHRGGDAVLNRDNPWFEHLADHARGRELSIFSFGRDERADARLLDAEVGSDGSRVRLRINGWEIDYELAAVGAHWAFNSVGVLAAIHALELDVEQAARAIGRIVAGRGRGAQSLIALPDGGGYTLIDESYNANPASMRAALSVLGLARVSGTGRRIAVLGDMRELGARGPALHAGLGDDVLAAAPSMVFTVGPLMLHLREQLPADLLGQHADRSGDIAGTVAVDVRDGDVVLVKGSLGTRMAPIVAALRALRPAPIAINGH